jgi:hypothetical protein
MAVYKEMKGCTDNQAHEEIDVSDIPAEEETYSLGELY